MVQTLFFQFSCFLLSQVNSTYATSESMATSVATRERRPSTNAPISELKGPVGPEFTRPKHKRTATGFGPSEIKSVESSIPEPQRDA